MPHGVVVASTLSPRKEDGEEVSQGGTRRRPRRKKKNLQAGVLGGARRRPRHQRRMDLATTVGRRLPPPREGLADGKCEGVFSYLPD